MINKYLVFFSNSYERLYVHASSYNIVADPFDSAISRQKLTKKCNVLHQAFSKFWKNRTLSQVTIPLCALISEISNIGKFI